MSSKLDLSFFQIHFGYTHINLLKLIYLTCVMVEVLVLYITAKTSFFSTSRCVKKTKKKKKSLFFTSLLALCTLGASIIEASNKIIILK